MSHPEPTADPENLQPEDRESDEQILSDDMSNCCGAPIYSNLGVCSECHEHCGIQKEE